MRVTKIKVGHDRLFHDSYVGYGLPPEIGHQVVLVKRPEVDTRDLGFNDYIKNFVMQTSPVTEILKRCDTSCEFQTQSGSIYKIELVMN